jgi:hypothetical protein
MTADTTTTEYCLASKQDVKMQSEMATKTALRFQQLRKTTRSKTLHSLQLVPNASKEEITEK